VRNTPFGTIRLVRAPIILLAASLALAVPCGASAHGEGGKATGFTATIERVSPATPGLELRVLDGDDRLYLRNETGREVTVLGYDGEPYLRFDAGSVYGNVRSPAVYLNADRYARGEVPASANPDAPPVWRRVRLGHSHEWHDHRIQWMSTIAPDEVRADPDSPRHIFDWQVRIAVDGRPTVITGSLDYAPVGGEEPSAWVFVAASVPLVAACLAWALLRRRLRPQAATQ
jgi:hypothetical protein